MNPIRLNLWFDTQAEEAARFYVEVFRNARLGAITRYPEAGQELHGKPPGSVMTVAFELNGQPFIALNGGPAFLFNEAISLEVDCADQAELDYYWDRLSEGADPGAQQCGWLKDRFGLSWQIVPRAEMDAMMRDTESEPCRRAFQAMLQMKKLDIAALRAAFEGERALPPS